MGLAQSARFFRPWEDLLSSCARNPAFKTLGYCQTKKAMPQMWGRANFGFTLPLNPNAPHRGAATGRGYRMTTNLPRQAHIHPDREREHRATRDELKFG